MLLYSLKMLMRSRWHHDLRYKCLRLLINDRYKIDSYCFFICSWFLKLNAIDATYLQINLTIAPGYQVYFNLKIWHEYIRHNEQSLPQLVSSNRHFAILHFSFILNCPFLSLVVIFSYGLDKEILRNIRLRDLHKPFSINYNLHRRLN